MTAAASRSRASRSRPSTRRTRTASPTSTSGIWPPPTTVLASRADGAGDVGNGTSRAPAIAGNGASVAFESAATQFDHDNDSDTGPTSTAIARREDDGAGQHQRRRAEGHHLDAPGHRRLRRRRRVRLERHGARSGRHGSEARRVRQESGHQHDPGGKPHRRDRRHGRERGGRRGRRLGRRYEGGHRPGQRKHRARPRPAPFHGGPPRPHRTEPHRSDLPSCRKRSVRERGWLRCRRRAERGRSLCGVPLGRHGSRGAGRRQARRLRPRPRDRRHHACEQGRRPVRRSAAGRRRRARHQR